jgi:hypothetical protein
MSKPVMLNSFEEFKDTHPDLYNKIKGIQNRLIELWDEWKDAAKQPEKSMEIRHAITEKRVAIQKECLHEFTDIYPRKGMVVDYQCKICGLSW